MQQIDVVVIGAGQAGLAVSHELTGLGVEHVVLERGRVAETWRNRWDSFCLVTPNWSVRLPGRPYDGSDPDGFMHRDEVIAYLEQYALSFRSPVQEAVEINSLTATDGNSFALETTSGSYRASGDGRLSTPASSTWIEHPTQRLCHTGALLCARPLSSQAKVIPAHRRGRRREHHCPRYRAQKAP
jgi:putative flavoprotein involved in K+ transport